MNKKEIDQLEERLRHYQNLIPDYPVIEDEEKRRLDIDHMLAVIMGCLVVILGVTMFSLIYLIYFNGGA